MRTVIWRTLLARKARLLLSGFAIVLGVAFVAGSFVFTDTMARSFDGIVNGAVPEVTVRSADTPSVGDGPPGSSGVSTGRDAPLDDALVQDIADLAEVERADGAVDGFGVLVVRSDGRLLGGTGAPTLTSAYATYPNLLGEPTVTVAQGRAPRADDEVTLDVRSAELAGYSVGDTVTLLTTADPPQRQATLVGTLDFAGGGLAGATLVVLDAATAQDVVLAGAREFTSIAVTGAPGVSQAELARTVQSLLPDGFEAVTGDDVAAEREGFVGQVLGFLTTFLLVFGAIALVVGTFLIVNTFSILVAQRSRELALLRALGASRRQVTASVLAEAVVVGLIGSTLGLALGFALAALLRVLFASFGLDLAASPLVFRPRTAVAAYAVGVLVTVVAAWLPARRASSIPPVAAMRDDVALPEESVRRRSVVAVLLAAVGAVLLVLGLVLGLGDVTLLVGLGILAILLAIALASPTLAVPVLAATGLVYRRLFGSVGTLAWQNARRNPRRTAATASALMIGLALVTTMSVVGASVNASITTAVEKDFPSDYIVSGAVGLPFSPAVASALAEVDGVQEVSALQSLAATSGRTPLRLAATDLAGFDDVFAPSYATGSAPTADDELALDEEVAAELDVGPGDRVDLDVGGEAVPLRLTGTYETSQALSDGVTSGAVAERVGQTRQDTLVAVQARPGESQGSLGPRLEDAVADVPTVTVQDQQQFAEGQRAQVDQLLLLIYALLGLALVIAVLGIVNTLALSVVERTREIGLLRAVGLSRRQLRRMVRLEAIAIALLGALLGIVAGTVFGVVLQRSVVEQGVTDLAVPWGRLALFVLVAVVVGVLAAVLPARRAARLEVLRAIASE